MNAYHIILFKPTPLLQFFCRDYITKTGLKTPYFANKETSWPF